MDRAVSKIISGTIVGLSAAALLVGTLQVLLRYAFNTGVPWSEGIFVIMDVRSSSVSMLSVLSALPFILTLSI